MRYADYPLFSAFGLAPKTLTTEEAAVAPFDDRLASVWNYLVGMCLEFHRSLKGRERANCSPEDALTEMVIKLKAKDHSWQPDRGSYITFVGEVAKRELSSLRDKTHTIHSPRNSTGRLKQYQAESDAGTISSRRAKTFEDIRRSSGDSAPLDERDGVEQSDPAALFQARETIAVARDAVIEGVRPLTPFEARVVGETYGLWGREPKLMEETASAIGVPVGRIRRANASARDKIRARLVAMGHPIVASDN